MGGKQRASRLISFVAAILGLLLIAVSSAGGAIAGAPSSVPAKEGAAGAAQQQSGVVGPITSQAIKSDLSPALSSLPLVTEGASSGTVREIPMFPVPQSDNGQGVVDNVVQKLLGPLVMPTPIANFAGLYNYTGNLPPDTVGDVGPNHYVQLVNATVLQVFSKTGATLAGPVNLNTLFMGVGGPCETNNNGDPIVLHDQLADRWMLSQFGFTSQSGPTFQCIAISTSSDPTGTYHRYVFETATVGFDDYPHYGVWPDAYYLAANRFNAPGFAGAAVAFERDRMLVGDPTARMVVFLTPGQGGHLPSDLDGGTLPPTNSPNFYLYPTTPSAGLISEYKFDVDWANPALSTYTGPFAITVAPWDASICPASRGACIDQPGTTARLEAIADRFMHRLTYRNMGTHESLMVTHTVDADNVPSGDGRAGKRWYEFRDPNGARSVFQQGTYAPADGSHRWMGSLAMDRQGNMAVGFSASSTTLFPTIRYAGRLVTDPPGQMAQGEETLIAGGGSQTLVSNPRWGDYSSMNIDPRDDCTFWYTQEYLSITGQINWKTRIGSFRFPGCTGATATPVPSATGTPATSTPTAMATSTPCANSTVVVGSITNSDTTQNLAVVGGVNGQCGVTGPCTLTGIAGRRHYDSYTFTNTSGGPQCVTVNIDARACVEAGVNSVAYLNTFDPENLCTNFLGKAIGGPNQTYSFSVPTGATYIVVVREAATDTGCSSYTLSVNPCTAGSVTPVSTGTSTPVVTATATGTPTPCVPTYVASTATATMIPGGTRVDGVGCDDCTTNVTLPFPVTIYGRTYTTANVGSNGNMQFASDNANIFNPNCIPVSTGMQPPFSSTIFAYYDDLRTDELTLCPSCGIFTQTLGTAPNRQYVVRWRTTYFDFPGEANFQIVLTEGSNVPRVIYGANQNSGLTAAAGMQFDLTRFTQFSCDTAVLTDGLRIDYTPTGCATPTATSTTTPIATNTTITTATRTSTPQVACTIEFSDVPVSNPFRIYIRCLACRGVVGGYSDGTFRPYNDVTRGQASKMVALSAGFNEVPVGQRFRDVPPSQTFYKHIQNLATRGHIGGYSDPVNCPAAVGGAPCFRPERPITRGQLAKVASNAAGYDEPPVGQTFTDVPPSHTFYEFIQRLSRRGIVSGYDCDDNPGEPCDPQRRPYYRPQNNVTRGQTAKIVANTFFPECQQPGPETTPPARP